MALLCAAILGGFTGIACAVNYEVTQVSDETMEPFLQKGGHILVDRMKISERSFERGDIVLFPNAMYMETGEGAVMAKRIVGLPGEWVSLENGIVYIDGEPLDESAYLTQANGFDETKTKQFVDAGQYFVLGDNRMDSTDSRSETVGLIQEEDIQGKVIKQW